jgi:hypothetical protein
MKTPPTVRGFSFLAQTQENRVQTEARFLRYARAMISGTSIKTGKDLFPLCCNPIEQRRGGWLCEQCGLEYCEIRPMIWQRLRSGNRQACHGRKQ